MKYCSHCGKDLLDDAVICPACGCPCAPQTVTPAKWNGFAIAGFVVSFFFPIIGLILSIIGFRQCKNGTDKGKGLALAGIIISSVIIGAYVLAAIFYAFVVLLALAVTAPFV